MVYFNNDNDAKGAMSRRNGEAVPVDTTKVLDGHYLAPFGPPDCEGEACGFSPHDKEWHFTVEYQVIREEDDELEDRKAALILGCYEDGADWDVTIETDTGFKVVFALDGEPTLLRAVAGGG